MDFVECSTQAEVDRVTAAGDVAIVRTGFYRAYDSADVQAYGSASVQAYDSADVQAYDSASVQAYDSADVQAYDSADVQAYDSADVQAYDSADVQAYDSASVQAYDSASVQAYDSASVQASQFVAVTRHGDAARVDGGVLIQIPAVRTIEEWADFCGLTVEDGEVVVFKAVDDDLKSGYNMKYPIGGEVSAPDWDGSTLCGGGLHFCARPFIATRYFEGATRYLACAVKVSDAVVVASWDLCPSDKIKARFCRVLHEVDIDGQALAKTHKDG